MIEFIKTRNVKLPIRNELENAGIDVFIPEKDSYTEEELKKFGENVIIDGNTITVAPYSDVLIPGGIKSKFPNNMALIAHNKSGIATKKKLIVGACVIDSSYQGEWFYNLINTSNEPQTIEFGQKIVQYVPQMIYFDKIVVHSNMTEEEFYTNTTSRGDGAFGSTGV